MKILAAILCFLLLAAPAYAATYTVCASGCTSTTIGGVFSGTDLAPGDEVVVSAGTYREMVTWGTNDSGDAGGQVTLRSATGETVKILASDIETGFAGPDGNGEYTVAETTQARILYADGVRLTEGTAGILTATEWDWVANVLYLGFNPSGIVIEAGQRSKGVDVNSQAYVTIRDLTVGHANTDWEGAVHAYTGGDGIVIDNVVINGSYCHGIFLQTSDSSRISNCTITNTRMDGIQINSGVAGAESTGLEVYGNTVTGGGTANTWGRDAIYVLDYNDVDIHNNTIADMQEQGIVWGMYYATDDTVDGANIYRNTVTNVGITGLGMGIEIGGTVGSTCTGAVVHDNTIVGVDQPTGSDGYAIDLDRGSQGALVYGNWMEDCEGAGIGIIGADSTGNSVHYNVIFDIGLTAGKVSRAGLLVSAGTGNTFYNNTVYNAENCIRSVSASATNTFKNNILSGCVTNNAYFDATSSATLDYNLYYPDGATRFYWGGAASDNFADWKTDSSQDAHSVSVDPLFTGATSENFHLASNSPAINAGGWLTTITSATGSGTSFTVDNSRYFSDGNGIVAGDLIQLEGQKSTYEITDVTYATHTITIKSTASWTIGNGVSTAYQRSAPDMGAYETQLTPMPTTVYDPLGIW